jgi:4-hydroxy-tetrahydrodipicolinate synthase
VEEVGDRATVVANTGTYDTRHSVHLTELATAEGVDGILVVAPYYNKPPQRGIVAHFAAVAAATDRPVLVYNIPSRVVVNVEPATMALLAEIPNVRGVKQANDDMEQARRLADYVVRVEGGRVTAQGATAEVLDEEVEPAIAAAEDAT